MIGQNVIKEESFGTALKTAVRSNMRQYTMIAALLLIWVVFGILTGGLFFRPMNISNLFLQMVTIAILTHGMVLVMVAGNIDLSVGTVCGTLGALAAWLMVFKGVNPVIAISITLAGGLVIGLWHGFWIAFRGVPAFIVTLSSMIFFKGITYLICDGKTIGGFSNGFLEIGKGFIPRLFIANDSMHITSVILVVIAVAAFIISSIIVRRKRISNGFTVLRPSLEILKILIISAAILIIGMVLASYEGISYAVLLLLLIAVIYTVIVTRTPFGRHVFAIGGNREAARLSGVNIKKTLMTICISMGAMNAIAAIVYVSRLTSATADAGALFELDTIAACIIGGTSTAGGIGTIFGALVGALVMASLDNGMSLMNLKPEYQYIAKGLVLLFAVWIDIAMRKK